MRRPNATVTLVVVTSGMLAAGGTGIAGSGGAQTSLPAAGQLFSYERPVPVRAVVRGAGKGRVTSTPPGVDCRPRCAGKFPKGSTVILTAAPAARSTFAGWTGACTGKSTWCVFVARGTVSTRARFTKTGGSTEEAARTFVTRPILRVTVAVSRGGRVTSRSGEIACAGRCWNHFDSGARVELRAEPNPGYRFGGWHSLLATCGRRPTCTVRMNTTTDVAAKFSALSP
jgi:hypothetical protein